MSLKIFYNVLTVLSGIVLWYFLEVSVAPNLELYDVSPADPKLSTGPKPPKRLLIKSIFFEIIVFGSTNFGKIEGLDMYGTVIVPTSGLGVRPKDLEYAKKCIIMLIKKLNHNLFQDSEVPNNK